MNDVQGFLTTEMTAFVYGPSDILINMILAFILGLVISYIYKITHKGLSYSQSFMLTIVFVALIVSMVMMVIGNNLARAFALVGALTIIRFRTVIKDTKDTAYVFLALASGMAAGTSSYFLAISGNYRWNRILTWINKDCDNGIDLLGDCFQLNQSRIAISSGGMFGLGPGTSRARWGMLPNSHTDFIASIIGEEYGFVGLVIFIIILNFFFCCFKFFLFICITFD